MTISKGLWYKSLRLKLFVSFIVISFVPIVFFFNTVLISMENYYKLEKEKTLLSSANIIAGHIAKQNYMFDESLRIPFDSELKERSDKEGYRIIVLDTHGIVVNDSSKTEIGKTYVIPDVTQVLLKRGHKFTLNAEEMTAYTSVSIINDNSKHIGVVLLVASVKDIYSPISKVKRTLWVYTGVTIVVLAFLAFFGSKLLIDPMKKVLKVVQKMSEGHLNQRINLKGGDEFSELADSFNIMAQKLEQVENTREEFVSNVSHELKTPLSSIKVLTEAILLQETVPEEMYREFLEDINSEIDRMTNIVTDLLNLVKLDQREKGLNVKPTDLNGMITDISKRLLPLAEQKEIELTFEEIKKVVIDADEMKLSLAISNLIENGVKYTPNGGSVKVVIDGDHQNAFITVSDTGIGIAEDEQKKIFNRFYRVDKTRDRETGGTGLGLSITHQTVLLHNGSIKINSKENEGTSFIVRLPIHFNEA